ncbi:hypothetical protein BCR44DRAFT_1156246 [Catenaria anguillulae PL171]|uniref:Uncharacterized protein n=1 Tax=Catenaria anguillulae PL171 TaxID=765915 RepID=A0A1Y2HI86_9FUNG|nr:hypothetical protein BCR44DRAFT_1156246 [Catenaria anguillulae PL171]
MPSTTRPACPRRAERAAATRRVWPAWPTACHPPILGTQCAKYSLASCNLVNSARSFAASFAAARTSESAACMSQSLLCLARPWPHVFHSHLHDGQCRLHINHGMCLGNVQGTIKRRVHGVQTARDARIGRKLAHHGLNTRNGIAARVIARQVGSGSSGPSGVVASSPATSPRCESRAATSTRAASSGMATRMAGVGYRPGAAGRIGRRRGTGGRSASTSMWSSSVEGSAAAAAAG